MASKSNKLNPGDVLDLDVLDLDKMDDPFSDQENDKRSGPVRKFSSEFKKGFTESFRAKQVLSRALRLALPDGYNRLVDVGEKSVDLVKEINRDLHNTNASDLLAITKKAESILPKLKGKASDKVYDKLESRISSYRSRLEDDIRWKQQSQRAQSTHDSDEIARNLSALTEVQLEVAKHEDRASAERHRETVTNQLLRDRVSGLRFDAQSRQLGIIASEVSKASAYREQITYAFQKKSLEVQYRSMFLLRDIHKELSASGKIDKRAYDALIHNTSLPDHTKTSSAERVRFNVREGYLGRASTKIGQTLNEFLSGYYPTIRENLLNTARGAISGIGSILGSVEGISLGGNKSTMLGRGLGSTAGEKSEDGASALLARILRPQLERVSDRVGGQHNRLNYLFSNAPSILRDYVTDIGQTGWRGSVQDVVRSIVPSFFMNDTITDGSYQSIDRQTSFNQLTQRSIVEIIPGYLSRILHEARMLRTGDDSIEREVYDITHGGFVGYSEARSRMLGRVITETQRRDVSLSLDDALSRFDESGTLSPEAREALRERLLRDASTLGRFDPQRYAEGGYASSTDDATVRELQDFFRGRFDFDESGRLRGSADNYRLLNELSQAFINVRDTTPDVRRELQRLSGVGSSELLRDLGLIRTVQGQDRTDLDKAWSYYRNAGESQVRETGGGFRESASESIRRSSPIADTTESTDTVEDVFTDASCDEVSLTARGMESEEYVDLETGKTIRSWRDIRGDVVDRSGRLVVSGKDLAKGLYNRKGRKIQFPNLNPKFKDAKDKLSEIRSNLSGRLQDSITDSKDSVKDIYTKSKHRALLARDMLEGRYYDINTDSVVTDAADITGEVRDLEGNVVLTEDEYREGIYDATGAKVSTKGSLTRRVVNRLMQPLRSVRRAVVERGRSIGRAIAGRLRRNKDIYVEGEESPRITVQKMKAGGYLDAKSGRVITHFGMIIGDVMDTQGNMVLQLDEIPNTVEVDGTKHSVAKNRNILRRIGRGLMRPVRAIGRGLKAYGRKVVSPYYKWLGKKVLPKWLTGSDEGGSQIPKEAEGMSGTDQLLSRILGVLSTRLPDDSKPRKGSWQDILNRREQGEGDEEDVDLGDGKGGSSWLGRLGAGLASLFGLGDKGEQGEEEGEEGDTYIYGDIGEKKDKKGRKGRKSKPRGKIGRFLQRSKIGRAALRLASPLAKIGRFAMSGVGHALRGAIWAGGALISLVGAPVVLGTAAAAAAGIGGYMYYKRRKRVRGDLLQLRLAQYGFGFRGWSKPGKLMDYEAVFMKAVTVRKGEAPTIDPNRLDGPSLVNILGVDVDDEAHVAAWVQWNNERFKPVFLAHLQALNDLAPNLTLDGLDDGLPPEMVLNYLDAIAFPYSGETPYAVMQSPFDPEDELDRDAEDVRKMEDKIRHKYRKVERADPMSGGIEESEIPSEVKVTATSMAAASASTLPEAVTAFKSKSGQGDSRPGSNYTGGVVVSTAALTAASSARMDRGISISGTRLAGKYVARDLTTLEAIRLKAYGIDVFSTRTVSNILALEEELLKWVKVSGSGNVTYTGSIDELIKSTGTMFGVSLDSESESYTKWYQWVTLRFIPVFTTYLTAVNTTSPNMSLSHAPARMERQLSPLDKANIGAAVIGTRTPMVGVETSIWLIDVSPLQDGIRDLEGLESSARGYLRLLEAEADNHVMRTAETGTRTTVGEGTVLASPGTGDTKPKPFTPTVPNLGRTTPTPSNTPGRITSSPAPLRSPQSVNRLALGSTVTEIKSSDGGPWENIPFPASNKSQEAAMDTMSAVGGLVGIAPEILVAIAGIESSYDYRAKSSYSSATGWFQFINDTWDSMISKYGKRYGITSDPDRSLRLDPRVNALMGASYLKENFKFLKSRIGRLPTDVDLYMAHFLGPGGAVKFLQANVEDIAARLLSKAASSNRAIFYKPSGEPRTVGEVYRLMDERLSRWRVGEMGINLASDSTAETDMETVFQQEDTVIEQDVVNSSTVPGLPTVSISKVASSTINPNNGSVSSPLSRTPGSYGIPGGSRAPSGTTSGRDPVVVAQEEQRTRAAAEDRRQKEQMEENMQSTRFVCSVLDKQLKVQESMRDHLKEIAAGFKELKAETSDVVSTTTTNDTSRPTASSVSPGKTPLPISLRRA